MDTTEHPVDRAAQSESLPHFTFASGLALLATAISIGAGVPLFGHADDAEVTAKLVAEAAARKDCPLSIAQFGPGERWRQHHIVYACFKAARQVPAHILSMPVSR